MGAAVCTCPGSDNKDKLVEPIEVQPCVTEKPEQPREAKDPKLTITIVGARGLQGAGKKECYCELKTGGVLLHSSRCTPNTAEPTWCEEYVVEDVATGSPLTFVVYDKDPGGSGTLGEATLQSEDYRTDGFDGELKLQGSGIAEAYLRVKVKLAGAALPPFAPTEILVTAEKPSHDAGFGLALDARDGIALHVVELASGPFADFNSGVAPELQLRLGDAIVSVNGVGGSSAKMLEEFTERLRVECRVKRTVLTTVVLDRGGASEPLGMEFPEDPQGEALPVTRVAGGAAGRHNQSAKPADRLYAGDRILSVSGESGSATALKQMLDTREGKIQMAIRRVAALEP